MRGRIAQGLMVALLVSLGAAQGPTSLESANQKTELPREMRGATTWTPIDRPDSGPYQVGTASWYGDYFEGKPTASGEPFNMYDMTAAHPSLPLGTLVKVTNLKNRRAIIVRINDRGPVVPGRIIDLSYGAAVALHFKAQGLQRVRLDVVPRRQAAAATLAMLSEPNLD
jgi:rare lipoprotein A